MSRYQSSSRDSRDSRSSNPDCKVYVGGLGSSFDKHDIEESFKSFGPLRHVWVARNPPGFAFVEFEDPLDADDAVRGHRKRICGRDVTVEMSSGERKNRRFGGPGGSRPPPRRASRNDKCYFCSDYGHFARECPKNDGRGGGGRRYSGGGGGGGGYGGRSRDSRRSRVLFYCQSHL
ncbi:serine/arginine-rich splicing factor 7-like isoform X2 [Patiria miniata]|uniref:Uncharacterized protein n=1 Tax=Patiria miniata TaxID=46514 RepID=A0A913ZHR0_PATMI|nr:serine/arginine-rich splicing factor 7-like isoform X2 [Patiria miniata]